MEVIEPRNRMKMMEMIIRKDKDIYEINKIEILF